MYCGTVKEHLPITCDITVQMLWGLVPRGSSVLDLQASIVRKVDSAYHRMVIFFTVAERHKKQRYQNVELA